jgi:hypothetical protein
MIHAFLKSRTFALEKDAVMINGLGCFRFSPSGFCVVVLCQGLDQGQEFFAFVAVEPQNYRYFQKRYRAGELSSFRMFGRELVRGWGKIPPLAVMDHLTARHGVDFTVGDEFIGRLVDNLETFAMPLRRQYALSHAAVRS